MSRGGEVFCLGVQRPGVGWGGICLEGILSKGDFVLCYKLEGFCPGGYRVGVGCVFYLGGGILCGYQ